MELRRSLGSSKKNIRKIHKKIVPLDLKALRRQKDVRELYQYVMKKDLRAEAVYLIDFHLNKKKKYK